MLKHIIFDFDGTIANSIDLTIKLGNQLAAKYGYCELNEDDLNELRNLSMEDRLKKFGIKLYRLPKFMIEFKRNYNQYVGGLKAINGIEELICKLKNEGLNLGIISSNAVDNISDFLKNTNLCCFDYVFSSNGLFGKHVTIKRYLNKHNINKDDVVYIGDMLSDITACRKVGIRIIAVSWGFDPAAMLKSGNPDFIANTPDDVFNFIKSIK